MNHYQKLSKESLITRVEALEHLIEALIAEKNQEELLRFPWVGNLGNWHWNVQTNRLICNDAKICTLNYRRDEAPEKIGFEFFTSKLHPEDYERVMENMRQHLDGNIDAYEVEYRIQTKDGLWKWYYDRGKITKRDDQNRPVLVSGIVFDITEAKELQLLVKIQNKQLEQLVDFDCLTKLLNRRGLLEKLEDAIEHANKSKEALSLIIMDIDHFSLVNDTHGHLVGDKVLEQVARDIENTTSRSDVTGRYGGEEFIILLPNTTKDKAYLLGEKIRKTIEKDTFSKGVKITISGGISQYQGGDGDDLIDLADKRLYYAKENGRNQIVWTD